MLKAISKAIQAMFTNNSRSEQISNTKEIQKPVQKEVKDTLSHIASSSFTFQTIIAGEQGETLQHLGARNLLWHVGGAIARHPAIVNYGLTRKEISEGNGNTSQLDGVLEKQPLDLETLLKGFLFLTERLEDLAEFEDYDTRTGAPTNPFAWYNIPTLESYIRNFQNYRTERVNTQRQDHARALGIKQDLPKADVSSELDELVKNAMETLRGFMPRIGDSSLEDLESIIADMKIDPLYIIHQSAVGMLDRAKAALMAGKAGYIDPEILAFARWTCRPQQGMQAPQD
jgi:hypothetical protein